MTWGCSKARAKYSYLLSATVHYRAYIILGSATSLKMHDIHVHIQLHKMSEYISTTSPEQGNS